MNRHNRRVGRTTDRQAGFTLIELLVVVVVIGILITIAIPLYLKYREGAQNRTAQADLRHTVAAMEACKAEFDTYGTPGTVTHPSSWQPCNGQRASISNGTTIDVVIRADGGSWTGTSRNGTSGKTYFYDSLVGGSIG